MVIGHRRRVGRACPQRADVHHLSQPGELDTDIRKSVSFAKIICANAEELRVGLLYPGMSPFREDSLWNRKFQCQKL